MRREIWAYTHTCYMRGGTDEVSTSWVRDLHASMALRTLGGAPTHAFSLCDARVRAFLSGTPCLPLRSLTRESHVQEAICSLHDVTHVHAHAHCVIHRWPGRVVGLLRYRNQIILYHDSCITHFVNFLYSEFTILDFFDTLDDEIIWLEAQLLEES